MEISRNAKALVLSRQDYREYDSLVLFYTLEYGRLALVARGTKKLKSKLSGHLEPFSLVDLMIVPGKGIDYAAGAITTENFSHLKQDLNSLYYAGQAVSWLKRLLEDAEPDEEIFSLIFNYFNLLDEHSSRSSLSQLEGELIFSFFIFKLLAVSGYQPQTSTCLSCQQALRPGNNYFNLKNGGLVCGSCYEKQATNGQKDYQSGQEFLTISDNCVKLLRLIFSKEFSSINNLILNKKVIKELSILTKGFLNFRT